MAEPQPSENYRKSRIPTPSLAAGLGDVPAVPEQAHALPPSSHNLEATPPSHKASLSTAAQAQPKDYGAPWAEAAAENNTGSAEHTPVPARAPYVESLIDKHAAPRSNDQPGKDFAPSPSTVPPKQRSSLTDSLASQHPSTPGFPSAPFFSTTSAAPPPLSAAFTFGGASQAAAPAYWDMAGSQPPASIPDSTQQEQATVSTHTEQAAAPVLANGPSTQDVNKVRQAASSSSDGSGDTSMNLYPFPTERSAQDRLEGIASSAPHAQDVQGLYVFGRSGRMPAEYEAPATAAALLPLSHGNGNHVASPSGLHQVQP